MSSLGVQTSCNCRSCRVKNDILIFPHPSLPPLLWFIELLISRWITFSLGVFTLWFQRYSFPSVVKATCQNTSSGTLQPHEHGCVMHDTRNIFHPTTTKHWWNCSGNNVYQGLLYYKWFSWLLVVVGSKMLRVCIMNNVFCMHVHFGSMKVRTTTASGLIFVCTGIWWEIGIPEPWSNPRGLHQMWHFLKIDACRNKDNAVLSRYF
jgi:hypothetical protein